MASAVAQEEGDAAPEIETSTEVYGDWTVVCVESTPRACRMTQRLDVENEQGGGRLLQVTLLRNTDGVVIAMELPFGLDLRAGVVVRFDENEEVPLPFSTCYASGCQVIALLSPEHLEQFRNSGQMQVGFRALNQAQTLVTEVSLNGSNAALAELPEPVPAMSAEEG
ncbi:invasion associated locus B family protein [Spiribacter sp. 221]|uniref:invasion associated locus B family protein n=1 Tax=Spiribacter onubensis TaxID=3122420 RepID=UPI00349F8B9A